MSHEAGHWLAQQEVALLETIYQLQSPPNVTNGDSRRGSKRRRFEPRSRADRVTPHKRTGPSPDSSLKRVCRDLCEAPRVLAPSARAFLKNVFVSAASP
jgi:hypothetical protein